MPSYTFSIDSMHIDFQRSSIDDSDSDWMVFSVKIGLDIVRTWQGQVGTGIVSNTRLLPNAENPWLVDFGDINLSDDDLVTISMVMTNLSHTDTRQQQAEALKIAGAVGSALKDVKPVLDLTQVPVVGGMAIGVLASELLGAAIGILTAAGPFLALIGEIFGGTDTPNCNGLVFQQLFIPSGKQLRDLTQNFTAVHTETKTFNDQQSPHECGASPITEVVFSVVPNPAGFDLKRFIRAQGFDPSKGIRQLRPNTAEFSVKSAINNG